MADDPTRPVLRYHGGKWRLAPWIISHFPDHRLYVEPFGGAASVLLRKPRSYSEVYNDLNRDVVTVFRVLRDPEKRKRLENAVRLTPFSRAEYELAKVQADDDVERARRMIVSSFQGHIGAGAPGSDSGFRSHTLRRGATHADTWASWPDQIEAFTERLRGVVLECRDALDVIKDQDSEETLFYLDPPYATDSRKSPDMYSHEYSDADYRRLSLVLPGLQGMVILSGYRCDLMENLFGTWKRVDRTAQANGQSGGVERTESLWMNDAAVSEQFFVDHA